ncbi:lipopolysaccharide biosynthesis protein [Exiguobacterium mexicanum]|uniref:lipopolysaccharide biosynthesis protein n=1 Tax=Exiguobacterium mexicanum TaxID=340146 RepID=UPI00110F116B|nr:oligosaccharide flippase family protein [Exiguobacterium mexicanum]
MVKKSIFYLMGDLSVAFTQFAILILIAKFFSINELGLFTYFLAIIAPVSYLIQMQHRTVYVTNGFPQFGIIDYLISRAILFLVLASVSYGLLIVINKSDIIFILIFLWKFGEMLSDLIYGYWQKNNLIFNISVNKVIRSGIQLVVFTGCLLSNNSLETSLFLLALTTLLIFVFELRKIEKPNCINFNFNYFNEFVVFTLPLAIYSTLSILYINIPKYLIEYTLSVEEVAIYSTISYFLIVGNLVINSLIQVRLKTLTNLFQSNLNKFYDSVKRIIMFISILVITAITLVYLWGEFLLRVVYTEEISKYNDLLILLLIGSIFSYASILIGVIFTIAKEYSIQPYLSVMWCVIHLGTSLALIHLYGIYGSGYSFIISSIFQLTTSIIALKKIVINRR